tara:strand:+ start:825 stop:944 length:120 start_codon:yes stop_codon:yes gene_type:complete
MIKKIILIIIISFLAISCGKKNCPKNNEADKCSKLFKQN